MKMPDGWIMFPKVNKSWDMGMGFETRELVMCRNCQHWNFDGVMVCDKFGDASLKPDDYCSFGEKKMYSCDSCKHNDKNWDELPCDDCTMGGKTHYYEPSDDAETVPRSVFEQFKWERDIAIEQLEQLGYGFGEEPKTDGELVKKQLAVRAFAKYLRDSALIDYPDAGDTVRDWIPTAESALKDVPTEMPLIIHCTECKDWHERIASHWKLEQPEIIMCKNCKHYKFADNRAFGFPVKRCEWTGCEDVEDNDFCSRAERQEDGVDR